MKASSVVFASWLMVLPAAAGLFRVWMHQDAVQMGYSLSAEEHRRETLRASQRELEVELAAAHSPARLMKLASALGLKPPAPWQLQAVPPNVNKLPQIASADLGERLHGRP